jgi:hypothetical protein
MNHLTLDHIKEVESQVLSICKQHQTLDDIKQASSHLWEWVSTLTGLTVEEIRSQIETHETDEQFPTAVAEERDHLLKLPLVLLEIIHKKN